MEPHYYNTKEIMICFDKLMHSMSFECVCLCVCVCDATLSLWRQLERIVIGVGGWVQNKPITLINEQRLPQQRGYKSTIIPNEYKNKSTHTHTSVHTNTKTKVNKLVHQILSAINTGPGSKSTFKHTHTHIPNHVFIV